ncbi:Chitinase-like protein 1 [Forsythia ovata]|uniref:Chitinase-like protein 1 n=1 Tax=Forsythia ovata TaxID=205694 RepID=A0ABD1T3J7_9LAMI
MVVVAMAMTVIVSADSSQPLIMKTVKGKKMCDRGWECKGLSIYCCNMTISEYFQTYQFENLFAKRNTPVAHAVGFWDYHSFITAAALYQPHGFGTTGGKLTQMKEVAAFLGHVGSKTNCGYGVATGGPLAWGTMLQQGNESKPRLLRRLLQVHLPMYSWSPILWSWCFANLLAFSLPGEYEWRLLLNYNYGATGEALKVDLLSHPEYIEQNATLAFQAAIWRWMTPVKKGQPSAHDAFVGNWKPTKNDTLAKRFPGFGTTMNVLYGDNVCGQGDVDSMNNIVSHYQYYLDLMGVGREEAGPHEVLTCAEQVPFNPSAPKSSSSN